MGARVKLECATCASGRCRYHGKLREGATCPSCRRYPLVRLPEGLHCAECGFVGPIRGLWLGFILTMLLAMLWLDVGALLS